MQQGELSLHHLEVLKQRFLSQHPWMSQWTFNIIWDPKRPSNRQPGASRNCSLGRVGGIGGCSIKALRCTKENGLSEWDWKAGDLPGGPVGKTPRSQCRAGWGRGAWVRSLVGELDPTCMLQLRVHVPQLSIPHAAMGIPRAAARTRHSQNK